MRRPLIALVFLVLAVLLGSSLAAGAATPNDKTCRKLVEGSVSTKELLAYDACRFDKIDAQLAAMRAADAPEGAPVAHPTPTVTVKPSSSPTSSPTTTPTSSPTTPSSGVKPGASNTGVPDSVTLSPYTGPSTITADGTVIDGKDVTGPLVVDAKNVVIKNSRIHGTPSGETAGVYTRNGSTLIQDTEIYGFAVGLSYGNFTALRVDLHDITYDGIKLSSNARVQDSWIHDPKPNADAHWDGIQVQNGVVNTVIAGNNIEAAGADTNSALFLTPDLGPSTKGPLTVSGNWLEGGNFTVCILDGDNGKYFISGITVSNNRFGRSGQYGRSNVNVPIKQSGNVVDSTGAAYSL